MKTNFRLAALASVSLFVAAPPAWAQTQSANDQAQNGIADIVVTAQRRDESLSKTPVAVAVLSADVLAKAAIVSESDLQVASPGLLVRAGQSSNQINYAIRGQSLDPYSYARPGVLPYFDEVQIGGIGVSSAFYDLQSVQVLKGPQGTLFGRNATGGAVLFSSTKPKDELGGYISGTLGNYNNVKVEGAINIPLVADKMLLRVAGFYQNKDGTQLNLFNGKKLGGVDRYGLRGSVTIKPTDTITDTLTVDYYNADGTNTIGVISSLEPTGAFPSTMLYTDAVFPAGSGPLTGTSISDYVVSHLLQAQGVPAAVADALSAGNYARLIARINNPTVPSGGIATILAQQNARGPYKVTSNIPNNYWAHNLIVANTTEIQLGEDTRLKNIFGYTRLNTFTNNDVDGSGFGLGDNGTDPTRGISNLSSQVSDELQLLGKGFGGQLDYVLGAFYSYEKNKTLQYSSFFDVLLGGQVQTNDNIRYNTTWAGYAQGTYALTDNGLGLTLGARYTSEKVRSVILKTDSAYGLEALFPAIYDNDQSRTFNKLSWTLGLQQQVNPSLLVYLASRRSYKNGGFNAFIAPKIGYSDVAGNAYRTEVMTDLEGGIKFQGRLGSMPTRMNLALYHDWVKNSQRANFVLVGGAPQTITVNVPAKVYGFELDGMIEPASWLQLGGSLNYTHARFDPNKTVVVGTSTSFETYPDTPKWSASAYADVTLPLSGSIDGKLHADLFHQTMTYFSSTANLNPGAFNKGYTLVNLRAGIESSDRNWSLTANVKNVFNKIYYVGGLALGQLVQINTRIPGEPRTFTVEARIKF